MTTLEFISGMKKLGSFYFKELTNEQISLWYEMFQDVSVDVFNQAIKEISRESKFMPNAMIPSSSNKPMIIQIIFFILFIPIFIYSSKIASIIFLISSSLFPST